MKKWGVIVLIIFLITAIIWLAARQCGCVNPIGKPNPKTRDFDKYSYSNLRKTKFESSQIKFGKVLSEGAGYVSRMFYFKVSNRKVSGLINIPTNRGTFPVIVMIRGYVDLEIYQTGIGTQHGGEVLAQNGFITLAPDFLGYGESEMPFGSSMEERFLTYPTILTLIASIKNLNQVLEENNYQDIKVDSEKIGIWAHSNGGQIALSVLEISGKDYPTVLWAPVSKPFPYSILYYTDEFDDNGRALRKVVSDFENTYECDKYSLTNYLNWIKSPIQLHQGGIDEAVPQKWSDNFVKELEKNKIDVEYFTYPNEDHNFSNGSWGTVIERTVGFYKNKFNK